MDRYVDFANSVDLPRFRHERLRYKEEKIYLDQQKRLVNKQERWFGQRK